MDQSSSVSASNASTLAGLLALLNGGSSSANGSNDLFAALLSETDTTSTVSKDLGPQKSASATATAASYACPSADNTATNTLKALSDLSKTMHKIISVLCRDSNGTSNNASDQGEKMRAAAATTDESTTTTESPTSSDNPLEPPVVEETGDVESTQDASATDLTDVDLRDPQTLEDVLAELVVLIQYIQQRLQEMQAAQAEAVTATVASDSIPTTPLLDALERLFGTPDLGDSEAADASAEDGPAPRGLLEALFHKTNDTAEKLVEALADRAAEIATGDADDQTDTADELSALVDLGTEIRDTLSAIRGVNTLEETPAVSDENEDLTATTAAATGTSTPSNAPAATTADAAALNAVVVASAVTQKFAAAPAASNAKAADIMAPRVPRSETQSRAATAATTASTTSTLSNATSPSSATSTTTASVSAHSNADFDAFLSNSESFTRGSNDNLRSFSGSPEGVGAMGSYSFSSTLSALRAANGGTTGLPSAVDQVILHMNRCVKNGDTRISLQLQPGDMGKITIKLDVSSDGNVQGTVLADNPKTLELLQKDSRSLERALQDAGLRAEPGSLEFSLSGQNDQNAGQSNNGSATNGTFSATDSVDDTVVETTAVAETYYIRPSGVNIRV